MSLEALAFVKVGIALLAAGIVAREVLRKQRSRATVPLLAVCAALSLAAYFRPAADRNGIFHRWEMFHYYVGAKYHAELGYERLYECVAVADAEARVPGVSKRRIRDLRTDQLVSAAHAVATPRACTAHFSPARWAAFSGDVAAFRKLAGAPRFWRAMQLDHGYNPPPLWTVVGRSLVSLSPPTARFLTWLALIDFALMGAALGMLGWGFGARVALLGAVFWGTQAASDFGWTGGGLLRQDWLCAAVVCLALLRKKLHFWAGCALAVAALLRLFPAFLFAGPALLALRELWLLRALSPERARFWLGAATTVAVLVLFTLHAVGPDSYARFWEHIQLRHTSAVSNHMSLRTLFAFSPDARFTALHDGRLLDPATRWAAARTLRLASLGFAYHAGVAAMVLGVAFTVWRTRVPWLAVALSLPLIPAVTDPACYYYSVWLLAVVLTRARPAVGVTLLGLAAAGQLLGVRLLDDEERYFALAVLYVMSALVMLAAFSEGPVTRWRRFRERAAASQPPRLLGRFGLVVSGDQTRRSG